MKSSPLLKCKTTPKTKALIISNLYSVNPGNTLVKRWVHAIQEEYCFINEQREDFKKGIEEIIKKHGFTFNLEE